MKKEKDNGGIDDFATFDGVPLLRLVPFSYNYHVKTVFLEVFGWVREESRGSAIKEYRLFSEPWEMTLPTKYGNDLALYGAGYKQRQDIGREGEKAIFTRTLSSEGEEGDGQCQAVAVLLDLLASLRGDGIPLQLGDRVLQVASVVTCVAESSIFWPSGPRKQYLEVPGWKAWQWASYMRHVNEYHAEGILRRLKGLNVKTLSSIASSIRAPGQILRERN